MQNTNHPQGQNTLTHAIRCMHTGTTIGSLSIVTAAGALPYLSHWKEMQAAHPFFSLPPGKLLAHARSEFERIAKEIEAAPRDELQLQVLFVAVLHTLGGIQQSAAAMPAPEVAIINFPKLFKLAYWKHYLDSKRFRFPEFKITHLNANTKYENISSYLDACFAVREDYERGIKEVTERAKAEAAEEAMRKLRDSWIVPVGKRALWKWVRAHFQDTKFQADAEGWISTLFLGSRAAVLEFDVDETDLMEEMILSVAPGGNAIMAAVRAHIDTIRREQQETKEAFTVDFGEYTTPEMAPSPEPLLKDFPSKVHWIRAKALWSLQQRAIEEKALPKVRVVRTIEAIPEADF